MAGRKKKTKKKTSTRKKKKSGKFIEVKVSRTGGRTHEVTLDGGRTIKDALEAADLRLKPSEEAYVNDDLVDEDDMDDMELEDGDRVVLVKNIDGGLN